MKRSGANLALLLLGGFRSLADAATGELAKRGHEDFRPSHDFAMRAIASGAGTASALGRRLSVSKQAAAKTIAALQERGYISRYVDADDSRRMRLKVTALGFEVMKIGENIFDDLRGQWEKEIGLKQLEAMERSLTRLLQNSPSGIIDPGWVAQDTNTSAKS
jgi:DNA-binding MarR family transcriptional regulator